MSNEEVDLLSEFNGNPPADDAAIQNFEAQSGIKLPISYVMFLKRMNGGEGFAGERSVVIYPIEKVLEYNRGYQFREYVPELFLFGSDGGGEAFAFDRRTAEWSIVMVPFIPLTLKEAIPVASSFTYFFEALANSAATGPG